MTKVVCLWKIPNKTFRWDEEPYSELDIYPRGEIMGIYENEEAALKDKELINERRQERYDGSPPWTLNVDFQRVTTEEEIENKLDPKEYKSERGSIE